MRIKQFGDAILREKSSTIDVSALSSPQFKQLLQYMKDTLNGIKAISDENGNALSAPQCGHLIRLILLRINGEFVPMINPEIIQHSEETFAFDEECFSAYDLRAKVTRFTTIDVHYLDEQGNPHQITAQGELSGLIQHEIDHLNGILFTDRVEDKSTVLAIDKLFQNDPSYLAKLKTMKAYMEG